MNTTVKGFLAIGVLTAVVAFIATLLNVGAHHSNPIWALGTAIGFIILLISDVALFFAITGDEPFKWEK